MLLGVFHTIVLWESVSLRGVLGSRDMRWISDN